MRHAARPTSLAFLLLFAACGNPTGPDAIGQWGGPDANLSLTRSGGTVEYGCGTGTIDSSWTLSTAGEWNATGQHFTGGGPVPIGGHPPHPAQYAGTVDGSRLTFTVTLTDLHQVLGPFVLERGRTVSLNLCV